MLERNKVPKHVQKKLESITEDFCAYSFDVTRDGRCGLILGIGQDPDFPELHVFDEDSDQLHSIDCEKLIDSNLSRAFWAENENDIYIVDAYRDNLSLLVLDDNLMIVEIKNITSHINEKTESVSALVHFEPEEEPIFDDKYEDFFHVFLKNIRAGLSLCETYSNRKYASDEERMEMVHRQYFGMQPYISMLKQWNDKHEFNIDISDIIKNADEIRSMFGYEPFS